MQDAPGQDQETRRELEAAQFRLLVESVADRAVVTLDENGVIASWNEGAAQLHGYRAEDVIGRHFSLFHADGDSDGVAAPGMLLEALEHGAHREERMSRRKDGTSFWAEVRITPVRGEGSEVVGFTHLTHDLTDRRRRLHQDAEHAITRVLAEPLNFDETIRKLLQVVCETLGWDIATFWHVDDEASVLRAAACWHAPGVEPEYVRALTQDVTFAPGAGLPGRVWITGAPAWITDVLADRNFPRQPAAREADVHGAFAAPVRIGDDVLGVMEFFSRQVREPDQVVLATLASAGINIGQLVRREQAERQTRESEARFRAFTENATVAIVIIDEASTITYANAATGRIFGYAATDLLGQPLTILMPASLREQHHSGMKRYVRTGQRKLRWEGVELVGLKADGAPIPLEISFGEFTRGGRHYFTGIMRDISERKLADEALQREAEQRAAVIATQEEIARTRLELGAVMQVVVDRAAALTDAAGAAIELVEGKQLVYRAVSGAATPYAGQRLDIEGSLSGHALQTGRALKSDDTTREDRVDLEAASRVGARSMIIVPLFHRAESVGALKVFAPTRAAFDDRDVETLQLMAGLIGAAMARAAEAEARLRLIRGFSHDVKNPLGVADGFLALMQDELMGELTEKQKSSIARARTAIGSAKRLIDDLLDLARAESGEIELHITPLDLRRVAHDMAEEYRAQAQAQEVTIDADAPEEVRTETDVMRVRQIIGNLLSNALKYAPGSSVTIRVGTRRRATSPVPCAVIDVADTGPGVPTEKQHLLFQEFKRLEPSKAQGVGLGLAISKRIAEALHGDITVDSAEGVGSTFTLWLPLAP